MPDAGGTLPRRPSASELTGELPLFVAEALVHPSYGLDESAVQDIDALVDLGLTRQNAQRAVVEGRVPLALIDQVIGEPRELSLEDVVERSGVPGEVVIQIRGALGMRPRETFGESDVAWAQLIARLIELVPVEGVIRAARGRGQALTAVAMNDLGVIRDGLILPMREQGADDLTVAVALAETMRVLLPVATELLELTYRMQLETLLGSEVAAIAATTEDQQIDLAVGFVDVVGYTALSSRIDPAGLDEVLDAFEDRVLDVVSRHAEVAVVKYLGDAAMLVAPNVERLADAMIDLCSRVDSLEEAPLRGGMAAGPVLVREGDYFGVSVNMAARLTDLARPWTFLVAEDTIERFGVGFEVRRILPTRIRGFGLRRPLTVAHVGDPT